MSRFVLLALPLGLLKAAELIVKLVHPLTRVLRHRRQVLELADLTDRELKDIGLLRSDVMAALGEPWHRDPSRCLVLRADRSGLKSGETTGARPLRLSVPQAARPTRDALPSPARG